MGRYFLGVLSLVIWFMCMSCPSFAQDTLGFDGEELVTPNCVAMPWFDCRNITDPGVPANVFRGYQYIHHTSITLGPDSPANATNRYGDGSPYVNTTTSCTSCHFTGGHVPFGTPFYQVPDKYASRPYFRPLNYNRDVEDSIIDCLSNCMNNPQTPPKGDPILQDMVAYIEWVANGVNNASMKGEGWPTLPGHALPTIPGMASMTADPVRGEQLYNANPIKKCSSCHEQDGGGDYRPGENRPRVPALWGSDSYTRGAAFYNNQNMGAYIREHMPLGNAGELSGQDALDIAAYINDQPHPDGLADRMFTHTDADNIPASLRKPAAWNVGVPYPGEPFTRDQIMYGPWAPITEWRNAKIARLLQGMKAVTPSNQMLLLNND
jgi:cytochrome c